MSVQNAKLGATLVETPEGEENIIRLSWNGKTFGVTDIKWVMEYVGPTGISVPSGILREITQQDFNKIISEGLEFKVQEHPLGKVLHFIQ
jgi:hypothetical protein